MPSLPKRQPISQSQVPDTAYIGIDPGQAGGIAILYPMTTAVFPMPPTRLDTWSLFNDLHSSFEYIAVVEQVHSMPRQGVASSFKFGMNYERVCMSLTCAGIPYRETPPQTWLRHLSIPPRKNSAERDKLQWKKELRAKAQQLYPGLEVWKKTMGLQLAVCDALLIAHYCKITEGGGNGS